MTPEPASRRRFLDYCTDLLLAVLGLLLALPALGFLLAPLWKRRGGEGTESGFVDVGALDALPVGSWHLLTAEVVHQDGWKKTRFRHAVWVRRNGPGQPEVTALSSICPHLGCPINWHPDEARFVCPCHGGIFKADGEHAAGPPPRSMDPLDFEVRAGRLWVRWQDFEIGVAQRVPVTT
jgi:nitrite reductase/ring-hydroxylating ferredoxin subunit